MQCVPGAGSVGVCVSIRARVWKSHIHISHTGTSEICAWPGITIVTEGGQKVKKKVEERS